VKKGGILLKLDSNEVALWFQNKEICKKFLEKLHQNTTIKLRSFHIVVQFVPLTLHLEKQTDLQEIEEMNGLGEGNIQKARWIKPVAWC
jgi:hypothetical protein